MEHPWTLTPDRLFSETGSGITGLSTLQADAHLERDGNNVLRAHGRDSLLRLVWRQLGNPLVLILVAAAGVSLAVAEWTDAAVIVAIVGLSAGIGTWREWQAGTVVEGLRSRITLQAQVLRDGVEVSVPSAHVVVGDVMLLRAGSMVPADGVMLQTTDCFVNQAALTGENFPVEKHAGALPADTGMVGRTNMVFLGTSVQSGTGRAIVVATGGLTVFGGIAGSLATPAAQTDFDRGMRDFGRLLTGLMTVIMVAVFAANVVQHRPVLDALLFSVALAVGITPELLPAILTLNLTRAAQALAAHGVLVKRLNALENLGSMTVLCTDKTGTLTEGQVGLSAALDVTGAPSATVMHLALLNAALQTGLPNPLDGAITAAAPPLAPGVRKLDEIPYDFHRKRLSVVVDEGQGPLMVTKGALESVLALCTTVHGGGPLQDDMRATILAQHAEFSRSGFRVLGVAARRVKEAPSWHVADEVELGFAGFLTFLDPPRGDARQTLDQLRELGVAVKIITGDNRLVAQHVAQAVGMERIQVLTGSELQLLTDDALWQRAQDTDLFAEVDPSHKQRIILALQHRGAVVGYLGDGINDAPALHSADVSISVKGAVDVARDVADVVLLERGLGVLRRGIEEGRATFANTQKYVLTTTSANLGNMISMAMASLWLPFLPLLPSQILLNNFLSDIPAMGIASDTVDPERVATVPHWNMGFIRRFMLQFGLVSSLFDLVTFALLERVFHATEDVFRSAWFVESLITELAVALVLRTRRRFWKSRPGKALWWGTVGVFVVGISLPWLPGASAFWLVPIPLHVAAALLLVTGLYVAVVEVLKPGFYRREASRKGVEASR